MSERREELTVGSRPRVELRLSAGRILVDRHEPGGVEVRIDGKNADGFTIEQYGDGISIRQSSERGLFGGSHRVSLRVPDDSEIDISVASADVDVLSTVGDLRVSAASGDLSARRVDRDLTLKTASGDIDVEHVGGRVQVTAASGDINIREIERHCTVSSASGDVDLGDVAGDLRAKTASGDVSVRRFSGSELDCKTVSGDLTAGIAGGRRVEVDLQTMTGSVHLPDDRRRVTESEDGDAITVRFRSVSGDVRLERA